MNLVMHPYLYEVIDFSKQKKIILNTPVKFIIFKYLLKFILGMFSSS